MAFDPFTWAIGFGLTKSLGWLGELAGQKTLQTELDAVMKEWSKGLPGDHYVDSAALFPDLDLDADPTKRPALTILRTKLRNKYIPTAAEWQAGLLEQWEKRKRALGKTGQAFFLAERATVDPLLDKLATDIHRACVNDEPLFKGTVVTLLDQILAAREQAGSINLLPEPLSEPLEIRQVAMHVEAETGSCIHAAFWFPERGDLFLWGVFPCRDAKGLKWTFASSARIVSGFSAVKRLALGFSLAADLANTDGAGDVAPIGVLFSRSQLDALAKPTMPGGSFWAEVEAFVTIQPNSPFEFREGFPFRHWEEQGS